MATPVATLVATLARNGADVAIPIAIQTEQRECAALSIQDEFSLGYGEWFADIQLGVPHVKTLNGLQILGTKNPNITQIRALYRSIILNTPGIVSVIELKVTYLPGPRTVSYSFVAVCIGGGTITGNNNVVHVVGDVALAGAIYGAATVGNSLSVNRPLTEAIAGSATVTETLVVGRGLTLTDGIEGVATVTPSMGANRPLAEVIAGVATATANMTVFVPLTDAIAGVATVAANLSVTTIAVALADAIEGVATVTEALSAKRPLTDAIAAKVTVTEALSAKRPLTDAIVGVATVTEALSRKRPLTDAIAGAATATANLTVYAPPTITAVNPNFGSAAGGWAVNLVGTNFVAGATVKINGVSCTSVVVSSSTLITCVAPAYSTANGSSTGQTLTVSTTWGSASTSTNQTNYFYLPSNTTFVMAHSASFGVTQSTASSAGTVSAWADMTGNGNNYVQATSADYPYLGANYNSTGLPYIYALGAGVMSTGSVTPTATSATIFFVGNFTSATGVQIPWLWAGSTANLFLSISSAYYAGSSEYITGGTADTSPHTFGILVSNLENQSEFWVDETEESGTSGTIDGYGTLNGAASVFSGEGYPASFRMLLEITYAGTISSTDFTTVMAICKAIGGTP